MQTDFMESSRFRVPLISRRMDPEWTGRAFGIVRCHRLRLKISFAVPGQFNHSLRSGSAGRVNSLTGVNPRAQRRDNRVAAAMKPDSNCSVLGFQTLESDLAPFPEPRHHLSGSAKPDLPRLQALHEPRIK